MATGLVVGTQVAAAAGTHQVQPGETLSQIAGDYHVTVEQLARANGIADPNLVLAGTSLTIGGSTDPGSAAPLGNAPAARSHTVVPGETLTTIAAQFGVTVDALAQANGISDLNLIQTGSTLSIPGGGAGATKQAKLPATASVPLRLVAPGETLTTIAQQYGVSVPALAAVNNITDLNYVRSGDLIRIPGSTLAGPVHSADGTTKLRGMPVLEQSLPLSCEAAALSEATAYWGNQVSEWVFIENMPYNPNPHLGFRGQMTGAFGGTTNYGVYAEPLVPLLNRYGFTADLFYAEGDAGQLKSQINSGHPVVVWLTNMASVQPKTYATDAAGRRFALVPQEHAVVVYGYDANGVYIADPGDGVYRQLGWDAFMRSWGYFDGMSLAVYPAS